MRRLAALVVLCAWPTLAFAGKAFPPSPRGYVYNEGVVGDQEAARLSQELSDFEQATGHQFVVALFRSLDGEDVDDYTNRLFGAWKVGDAKRNDGVLFAVYKDDHRWRVEVGYGLEPVLTDLQAARIVEDGALPRFKQGDFDGGVDAAVAGLLSVLTGAAPAPRTGGGASHNWLVILFVLVLIAFQFFQGGGFLPLLIGSGYGGFGGGGFGGGGGFMGGGGMSGGGGASGGW